jgi:hypothetical protein
MIVQGAAGVLQFRMWMDKYSQAENYDDMERLTLSNSGSLYKCPIKIVKGTILYRCRPADNLITNVSELGYRRQPSDEFGRCDRKKQSVLYLSASKETSIKETIEHNSDCKRFILSVWEVQQDLDLMIVINTVKSLRSKKLDQILGKLFDDEMDHLAIENPEKAEATTMYLNYFDQHFKTTGSQSYRITAAYSQLVYNHSLGLIYSSVKNNDKDSYNLALNKLAEDNGLVKIVGASSFNLNGNDIKDAVAVNYDLGEIKWNY